MQCHPPLARKCAAQSRRGQLAIRALYRMPTGQRNHRASARSDKKFAAPERLQASRNRPASSPILAEGNSRRPTSCCNEHCRKSARSFGDRVQFAAGYPHLSSLNKKERKKKQEKKQNQGEKKKRRKRERYTFEDNLLQLHAIAEDPADFRQFSFFKQYCRSARVRPPPTWWRCGDFLRRSASFVPGCEFFVSARLAL